HIFRMWNIHPHAMFRRTPATRLLLDPLVNVVAAVCIVNQPEAVPVREHVCFTSLYLRLLYLIVEIHTPVIPINDEDSFCPRPLCIPCLAAIRVVWRASHVKDLVQLIQWIHV